MRIIKIVAWIAPISLALLLHVDGELLKTWRQWTDSKLSDSYSLWGQSILWWARTGKFLQFAAGTLVVIDLLSPEKLRERGAAARQMLTDGKNDWQRDRLARKLASLYSRLLHVVLEPIGRRNSYQLTIRKKNRLSPRLMMRFSISDLLEYARTTRATLPPYKGQMASSAGAHVAVCARRFLEEHLSSEECRALSRIDEIAKRRRLFGIIGLGVGMAGLLAAVALDGQPEPAGSVLSNTAVALFLLGAVMLSGFLNSVALGLMWIRRVPAVALFTVTAAVLDATRPGHVLRLLALELFIIGVHFDLLAS